MFAPRCRWGQRAWPTAQSVHTVGAPPCSWPNGLWSDTPWGNSAAECHVSGAEDQELGGGRPCPRPRRPKLYPPSGCNVGRSGSILTTHPRVTTQTPVRRSACPLRAAPSPPNKRGASVLCPLFSGGEERTRRPPSGPSANPVTPPTTRPPGASADTPGHGRGRAGGPGGRRPPGVQAPAPSTCPRCSRSCHRGSFSGGSPGG